MSSSLVFSGRLNNSNITTQNLQNLEKVSQIQHVKSEISNQKYSNEQLSNAKNLFTKKYSSQQEEDYNESKKGYIEPLIQAINTRCIDGLKQTAHACTFKDMLSKNTDKLLKLHSIKIYEIQKSA
jgi:hypothetical protein